MVALGAVSCERGEGEYSCRPHPTPVHSIKTSKSILPRSRNADNPYLKIQVQFLWWWYQLIDLYRNFEHWTHWPLFHKQMCSLTFHSASFNQFREGNVWVVSSASMACEGRLSGTLAHQTFGVLVLLWLVMYDACSLLVRCKNSLFFLFFLGNTWKKSSVGRFERIWLIIFFPWICVYPHSVDHVPSQSPVHVGSNIVYGGQFLSIRLSTTHIGYRVQFSMFDGQLLWWMVKLSLT